MNSKQLHYFATIYESGTLSKASIQLNVAVSALSHHLSNLEAELDTRLFDRKSRGLRPTASGERLYDHARSILRAIDAAREDLRISGREVSGDVAIGMAHSGVKAIGVPLIERMLSEHPKLRLSISESLSGATLKHLLSTEVDLALIYNPPSDTRLRTWPVLEESMVCVGKRAIIGDTEAPIRFREMLELPVIMLRHGVFARAQLDDAVLLKQLEARARLQMNSVYAIAGAIRAGLGCVIGTRLFMGDLIAEADIHARPIIEPELKRTLYVCELTQRRASFAIETVRDTVIEMIHESIRSGVWDAEAIGEK
ncbi:LysR family transcriptional regulator [Hoeflea sp. WL0058]|uniref:LysR family transcriptional regulator n=1 Tax=Flavimaribacter sediminis TaxID=2865987 RepID=A0AAE2ZNF0_9HYPH|nr:LysR family transcriptional regulator [Flavimaribacter sediminis]MBW8639401.1 LysR family transcriptional regulator [Flavimaribacter sediminis]